MEHITVCTSNNCPRYYICANAAEAIFLFDDNNKFCFVCRYSCGKCDEDNDFQYFERAAVTPEMIDAKINRLKDCYHRDLEQLKDCRTLLKKLIKEEKV